MSRNTTGRAALDFARLIARMDPPEQADARSVQLAAITLGELITTARALAMAEHREIDPHCTCPDCVRFHFETEVPPDGR
jgi:hypothetical protein